jgi:hypothetical protein
MAIYSFTFHRYHAGKNGIRTFVFFVVFWSLIYAILFGAIYFL